ncbi:MAG: methionine adenosyltransferase domain-containing protein [Bacillus subtilis]|nr:methionine adenosyltransferase domain-containing protein [Bacillus subtilis]
MVAAGLAERCEVQVAYAIGDRPPDRRSCVETFGTGKLDPTSIDPPSSSVTSTCVRGASSTRLDLQRPIYRQTAAYGHFGRTDLDLPWERLDKVDVLRPYVR